MTPRRVELLIERRKAIRESGLTLDQLEVLSQIDRHASPDRQFFTDWQRWLWKNVIFPIGLELGDEGYTCDEEEEDDGLT